ncbi:hypothetical protein BLA60_01440 [Actinophytocola xinjiangensis]|uniref:Endonuclease/exonuclease/phosphatase domain-containing protein n=1 Tax=Actinophytocola xinjiangensis TaxID=485602 RepID=A0A7Z0WSF7_9PSEU|nr:endonuclease/exonuclease/phosphatase family protein [Actinophytocola xinjiangensis]OLF13877.1 hypothetical protein BLA60_01440 [Actinophytocola xinjiangensis]
MRIKLVALAAAACAALAVVAAAPTVAAAPESDAGTASRPQERDVRFLDFNFAGNGFNGGDTGAPVTDTANRIAAERAEIIGLNEMCYTQWVALRDALKAKPGYAGLSDQVVVTNYDIPNCYDPVVNPDGWYVMGLMSKYDSERVMFGDTPYLDLGYHYRERYRKLVCGDVDIPRAREVRACVTHTEVPLPLVNETSFPNDPDIAQDPNYGRSINYAQAEVIAEAITPMAKRMPVALMGDLNELPFLPSLDFFYSKCGGKGVFNEVDSRDPRWPVIRHFNLGTEKCGHRQGEWTMGREGQPDIYDQPYSSNRRIDYIFVDQRHFTVGPESGWVITTPFSDHRIAVGDVTLKR